MMEEHKENKDPQNPWCSPKAHWKWSCPPAAWRRSTGTPLPSGLKRNLARTPGFVPQNLVDKKQFEVRTPDVTIKVRARNAATLVETRIIDGAGYILIRAEGGVEVNGVPIRLTPPEGEEQGEQDF